MVLDEVTCTGSCRAPRERMGCHQKGLTDCTAQMGKRGKTQSLFTGSTLATQQLLSSNSSIDSYNNNTE